MTRRRILLCGVAGELAGLALLWSTAYVLAWQLGRGAAHLLWGYFG